MPKMTLWLGTVAMAIVVASCAVQAPEPVAEEGASRATLATVDGAATVTLNTFITSAIQIDQLGAAPPGDANLFSGADPADGTGSVNKPATTYSPFIDWNDLGLSDKANHVFTDFPGAGGKDPTAFPGSNECVASASVLSKMDINYVAAANNNDFSYLAVQRSSNSGDAGWYWIFTQKTPSLTAGEAPCSASQQRLTYDISGPDAGGAGDIMVAGHFHPNNDALVRVFRAVASRNHVSAVNALNFNDTTLWVEATPASTLTAAVNTTATAPGVLGSQNVKNMAGANLDAELFEEVAVPLQVFTGGSHCGKSYYACVITRSSGSGGTSPDLKDLSGPTIVNFSGITAHASLSPSCQQQLGYAGTATRPDGSTLDATCAWSFDGGAATSSSCSGTLATSVGSHNGMLTVTDALGCSATAAPASAQAVYAPLATTASLSSTCNGSLPYTASTTGGSGSGSYAWTFDTGATSSTQSGSLSGVSSGTHSGTVTFTDARSDITCKATGSGGATVLSPITLSLSTAPAAPVCDPAGSDAVTYVASVGGGNGGISYNWSGPCSVSPDGTSCTVNPADSRFCASETVSVNASDNSGLCAASATRTGTYSKTTTVTASTN